MNKNPPMFNIQRFYDQSEKVYGAPYQKPSRDFLLWFMGFVEGDGCMLIQNPTYTLGQQMLVLEITLHSSDAEVLYFIKSHLGFGTVTKKAKHRHCFRIGGIKNISLLITLFNGNIVISKFYKRFAVFVNKYNEKIAQPKARPHTRALGTIALAPYGTVVPTLNDAWISGFTDAEGCFFATYDQRYKRWRYYFTIDQRGSSNVGVLKHLQSAFACGKLQHYKSEDHWTFRVHALNHNCDWIVPYFERFACVSKKKRSFEIWRHVLQSLVLKHHKNPSKNEALIADAKTINISNALFKPLSLPKVS